MPPPPLHRHQHRHQHRGAVPPASAPAAPTATAALWRLLDPRPTPMHQLLLLLLRRAGGGGGLWARASPSNLPVSVTGNCTSTSVRTVLVLGGCCGCGGNLDLLRVTVVQPILRSEPVGAWGAWNMGASEHRAYGMGLMPKVLSLLRTLRTA